MIVAATHAEISKAATLIADGGLVAFPTETVYGLGADAFNPRAVAKIFVLKARPSFDPLIVHVSDRAMLTLVVSSIDSITEALIDIFWPGPLTLILPKADQIPGIVTAGLDTVGVRMPAHPIARELIDLAATPIAAPSANRFGRLSPTRAEHVAAQLDVPIILDGGRTAHGIESTIVRIDGGIEILRHGAISVETLQTTGFPVFDSTGPRSLPQSPGQLESHYSPMTPLVIVSAPPKCSDPADGFLGWRSAPDGYAATEVLSPDGDLTEAAANLFDALHRLDGLGLRSIIAEAVPETGLGRAIMERLRRASTAKMP